MSHHNAIRNDEQTIIGRPISTLRTHHLFQWSKDQISTLEEYMMTSPSFVQFASDVKAKGTQVSESRLKAFRLPPELFRNLGLGACNNEELRNDLGERIRDIIDTKVKRKMVKSWAKLEESARKSVSLNPAAAPTTGTSAGTPAGTPAGASTANSKPDPQSTSMNLLPHQDAEVQSDRETFQDELSNAPSPIRNTWSRTPASDPLWHLPTSALPRLEKTREETPERMEDHLPPLSSRFATLNVSKTTHANTNPRPLRRTTSLSFSRPPTGPPHLPSHVSPIDQRPSPLLVAPTAGTSQASMPNQGKWKTGTARPSDPLIEILNTASPSVSDAHVQDHYDESKHDDQHQIKRPDHQYNQFEEIDQLFRPAPGLELPVPDRDGSTEPITRKSRQLEEEDLISADKQSELLALATEVEVQEKELIHVENVLLQKLNALRDK